MVAPFLQLVADDLYRKMRGNFQNATLVFPNKRASLFFSSYLWENAGGKTIWTPEYTTISELFASLSDHTVGDPVWLVVKLWEVYQQKMQPTKSLDQLYGLMEMMLSDFQDIDNNMVEPRKLFLNIADLKEMTDFSFLDEKQREAIEQFFGHFLDGAGTMLKGRFGTLWNRLTEIYEAYRAILLAKQGEQERGMVYEGLLKRLVVEVLTGKEEEARRKTDGRLGSRTYVMVGFNVLNKTELELFRYVKQNRDAKFYWDYDVAYTHTSGRDIGYEAGVFIMENIRQLGSELTDKGVYENMRRPKCITFIQSPTENAQTRYIDEWKRLHIKEGEPLRESAIVLCNENLLLPVLHSIGEVEAVNVTMGYPLSGTAVFSLVQTLLELQVHGRSVQGAWRYKQVAAVLKHALVQRLVGRESQEKLLELMRNNVVFPEKELFADHALLARLFTKVSGKALTTYLAEIISLVGQSYQETFGSQDFTLQMEKESIFMAYTVVNRIHTLQEGHSALDVSDETLMRLIMQLLRQTTIPFHGEPAVGLQVMGLLETRNLDFRNVIMLSVNEGQMPKSDKRASLIPYTLRAAYGMTTIEREVSLYAYYYYRLLQRAENITLLYNTSTEGGSKGEMSRFMLQTLAESDELFGKGQAIVQHRFTSASETEMVKPFSVVKDEGVMVKLHERFNEERILSPSAINTYMKCPLKFYFNYVAELRPDDEVSEDVDKPMFGTLFHHVMQKLYEPYVGKPLGSETLKQLAGSDELIKQKLNNAFAIHLFHRPEKDENGNDINYGNDTYRMTLNGTQLINRHVIKEFVINQITADHMMAEELESEGGYLQIVSQEKKYTTVLHHGANGRKRGTVLIGGYIDRLDLLHTSHGDRIRIVDYKTSIRAHTANYLEELFDSKKCTGNYHIMQTLYYAKVVTEGCPAYAHTAVVPALMYCAKDYGKNYSGIVKLTPPDGEKKEEMEDFKAQYGEAYHNLLTQKIEEIFTPYEESKDGVNQDGEENTCGIFAQCTDEQHCSYCDFLNFCRRHPKEK